MATGDHPKTAEAIAKQVEIVVPREPALILAAAEFDKMDNAAIDALPALPSVLARCSPQTKVKLIEALHRRDRFVAMTGDGSNDAPAIKMSDVGIAMGLGGSEVTKQVAAIVLTDDKFDTIVNAVAEGRRIFSNITKFVVHLLSGNTAEVIALVAGLGFQNMYGEAIFPMSPIQILWINMVTSSPIALALGQENADPDIMLRPPRQKSEGLFSKEVLWDTFYCKSRPGYSLFLSSTLTTLLCLLFIRWIRYGHHVPRHFHRRPLLHQPTAIHRRLQPRLQRCLVHSCFQSSRCCLRDAHVFPADPRSQLPRLAPLPVPHEAL
jgi:magnesium-transporting ATPase (P-type)